MIINGANDQPLSEAEQNALQGAKFIEAASGPVVDGSIDRPTVWTYGGPGPKKNTGGPRDEQIKSHGQSVTEAAK
jgi:hypothetical protein